jgi:hypothetical protein
MADDIILGLTQGDMLSILIVAIAAVLALMLLSALLKLSAALIRVGCLIVVLGVFIFALTKVLG